MTILHTLRLRFEPFAECNLGGLHDMNNRPEVMRYLSGQPETREQTADSIARVQRCWAAWATGWWVFVDLGSGRIAGGMVRNHRGNARPRLPGLALPGSFARLRSNLIDDRFVSQAKESAPGQERTRRDAPTWPIRNPMGKPAVLCQLACNSRAHGQAGAANDASRCRRCRSTKKMLPTMTRFNTPAKAAFAYDHP